MFTETEDSVEFLADKNYTNIMRIALYLVGTLVVVGAVCYGALELGVPKIWVGVAAAVIVGIGLMGAASNTKGSGKDGDTTINNG